ncbi:MAG: hypothetical protein ACOYLE_10925 [Bacteroidales bacterium]
MEKETTIVPEVKNPKEDFNVKKYFVFVPDSNVIFLKLTMVNCDKARLSAKNKELVRLAVIENNEKEIEPQA